SYALAKEIKALRDSKGKILVTGGGAYNDFLIDYLSEFLPQYVVHVPDTQIIDFKEALIFGFLGVLRLNHINNCLKSVTGASRDNCGGVVYYP
ncbi:MAG: anhydro-N-acetylmuramic acid kinase, partial [Cyclobacteriaceae bacterium]|nr:anhydro-N-acetylmuramic acid kinase [Cyclobacteriaceae bacterium]